MTGRLVDRILRHNERLLRRVRWMFVLFNVLFALMAPLEATYKAAPGGPRSVLMVVAFLGMGAWAVAYFHHEGRSRLLDWAPFALLLIGGTASGSWTPVLGRLIAAAFLHALYRPSRWRVVFVVAGYLITGNAVRLLVGIPPESIIDVLTGVTGMFAIASLMQVMASTIQRHERLRERDAALTTVTGALLTERDPDRISKLVAEGLLRLGHGGQANASLWREDGNKLRLAAQAGTQPLRADTISLDALPGHLRDVYLDGEAIILDTAELRLVHERHGVTEPWTSAVVAPIRAEGESRGLLVLNSLTPLDDELREAVQRFSLDVSLAQQLSSREALLTGIVGNAPDLIVVTDESGCLTFVSPTLTRWTGMRATRFVGSPVGDLLRHYGTGNPVTGAQLGEGAPLLVQLVADGSVHDVEVTSNPLADESRVLNIRDISERRRLEEEITHRAFHDDVTNLPNRALFLDELNRTAGGGSPKAGRSVVVMIDIDDFKTINDRLGHAAGDALLAEIASRLEHATRRLDVAARLGGDEFALLLHRIDDAEHAEMIVTRVLDSVRCPVLLDDREVTVGASAGIAFVDDERVDLVLRNADTAMYAAKEQGKNRHATFDPSMRDRALAQQQLRTDLETALAEEQLVVHYQPVMELTSERPVGVEALVRWRHPVRGLVSPDQFIPLAEETGMIVPLGRWVLLEACREVATWPTAPDAAPLSVAVNVSPVQLRSPTLVHDVEDALRRTGLQPAQLTLEVTETGLLSDADFVSDTLTELRDLGVRIAIDDFGTGYSSFARLQRFPVDIIKIDRSFVDGIDAGPEDAALAEAIIKLAGALRLHTIAEGVERPAQAATLARWGCTHAQGWLWAAAASAGRTSETLAAGQAGTPAETPPLERRTS